MNDRYFTKDNKIKMMCEQGKVHPHTHNFIEIVYFDNGKGWHNLDGTVYNVKSGDIYLIRRGVSHCYYTELESDIYSGFSLYNCIFDESFFEQELACEDVNDFLDEFCNKYMGITLDKEQKFFYANNSSYHSFKDLLLKMYSEYSAKESGYQAVLKAKLMELIIEIIRKSVTNTDLIGKRPWEEVAETIKKHVNNAPMLEISASEIADRIGFSVSHANKIFKASENKTIRQYIMDEKMECMRQKLETSDLSIEKLMTMYCFYDKKRFYERFKRYFGCTPKEYRTLKAKEKAQNQSQTND